MGERAVISVTESGAVSSTPSQSQNDLDQLLVSHGRLVTVVRAAAQQGPVLRDAESGGTILEAPGGAGFSWITGPDAEGVRLRRLESSDARSSEAPGMITAEWALVPADGGLVFLDTADGHVLGCADAAKDSRRDVVGAGRSRGGEAAEEGFPYLSVAADHKRVALARLVTGDNFKIDVLEAPGAGRITSLELADARVYPPPHFALDLNGRRMAASFEITTSTIYVHDCVARIYAVPSGELVREVIIHGQFAPPPVVSLGGCRWLLPTGEPMRVLHEDGIWGRPIPGTEGWTPAAARPLPVEGRDWVLVWNDRHQAVIDLARNALIDEWFSQGPDAVAFDGRVLVRSSGYLNDADFLDLKTLEPLFTLHPVPMADEYGWIATTPDGCWDSSAGAEKHLAVFRGYTAAGEKESLARRRPGLVGQRLAAVKLKPK
jgi:hypothetical protein